MLRLALMVTIFWVFQPTSTRAGLSIIYEDLECSFMDEEYFSNVDAYMVENNAMTINMTIMKRLPEDTECHVIMYGNSRGEFIIPSGIDVTMALCEILNEPIILGPVMRAIGFREDDCPPSPGIYGSEAYDVPTTSFPQDFIPNRYLFSVTMKLGDRPLFRMELTLNARP